MTTRTYQTNKRTVRRSRRIARQTDVLTGSDLQHGIVNNRTSFAA